MSSYVAFLRGINSGKNPTVRMETLRRAFEDLGLHNVRTVLASGNVLFEADSVDEFDLERRLAEALPQMLGYPTEVVVRTVDDMRRLVASHPFRTASADPHAAPFVSFVRDRTVKLPENVATGKGYRILSVQDGIVLSVVDLASATTPSLMRVLDKEYGRGVTTRSWKTVEKLVATRTS